MKKCKKDSIMSFDKNILLKTAEEVKSDGVKSRYGRDLLKKAHNMRVAFLTAVIKRNSK